MRVYLREISPHSYGRANKSQKVGIDTRKHEHRYEASARSLVILSAKIQKIRDNYWTLIGGTNEKPH